MEKKAVALLSAVFALCACAAWASVAGDGKASAAEVERVKASAEKGDAAAQFRYAEMLRAVPDGAFLYERTRRRPRRGQGGRMAISLLTRAAAQGHAGAKAKLEELGVEAKK